MKIYKSFFFPHIFFRYEIFFICICVNYHLSDPSPRRAFAALSPGRPAALSRRCATALSRAKKNYFVEKKLQVKENVLSLLQP